MKIYIVIVVSIFVALSFFCNGFVTAAEIKTFSPPIRNPGDGTGGECEKVVPVRDIIDMDYLTDIPAQTNVQSGQPITSSEYSLVTVDSRAFMKDADTIKKVNCTIEGKKYRIELTPAPGIISPDARLSIQTNEGTTITELPPSRQYKGRIIGERAGEASITVGDDILLAQFTIGNDHYFIDQFGKQDDGKIVHIVANAKNDIRGEKLPSGDDIYSLTVPPGIVPVSSETVPEKNLFSGAFAPLSVIRHCLRPCPSAEPGRFSGEDCCPLLYRLFGERGQQVPDTGNWRLE
jgi:hypothetical protein